MNWLDFVKENNKFDIIYRLVIWSGIAYLLRFLIDQNVNLMAGLRNTLDTLPYTDLAQWFGVSGLFIGGLSLLYRGIILGRYEDTVVSYLLGKISSDFVLAPYNIMSFGLGWGMYSFTNGDFEGHDISVLLVLLLPYCLIMALLAFVSLAVRSKKGELIYTFFYSDQNKSEPKINRIILSLSLMIGPIWVLLFATK